MGLEEAGINTLQLDNFSGGLNSNELSSQIKDNEASDAQNVVYFDGGIKKVPGFTRYSSQIGGSGATGRVTGIHDFQQRDGTQFLVVTIADAIYNFTSAPGTDITGGLTVNDALHTFITFNDKLIGTNYTDAPWIWDGTGNAAALGGGPPDQAKWVSTFNSRAVLGNVIVGANTFSTRVYFSAIDNPESWDTTDDFWEFESDDGQEITGIRQLKDKLVVYRNNSIGIVTGYGLQSWQVQRDFVKGIGCISGYSLKTGYISTAAGLKEVHIFMSEEGLKAFDGTNVYHMPIPTQGEEYKVFEYFDGLNKARFNSAVGEYYRKRNWFYVFHSDSGSSVNDSASIYDYNNNSLWPMKNINASYATTRFNYTTKEFELVIGTDDGILYYLDEDEEEIEQTTELVTNGSMEADSDWTSHGTPSTNDRSNVQALNGTWSRRCITDATDEGIYQDITTVVGSRYKAWCYVYVTAGEALIEKEDTDGSDAVASTTSAAASWVRLGIKFTATATTSRIIIRNSTTAASTFYVDDVSVRNADIDGFWESKNFDFGSEQDMKILREFVPFATEEGDYDVTFTLKYNKTAGGSTVDTLNLSASGTIWNTFIWNAATWGGREEIQDDLVNLDQDAFRSLRIRLRNTYGGQPFQISKILLSAKPIGRRWYFEGT